MANKASPQISVIVPVYNYKEYLRRCLDSILAQTFADWECIVVDDGSSDGSAAICDEYAQKDSRFVVIHKQNGGLSSARNLGLELAQGNFLMFCDQDDAMDKHSMEYALRMQQEDPQAMVMWKYTREEQEFLQVSEEPLAFERYHYKDLYWNLALFTTVWNRLFYREKVELFHLRFDIALGWRDRLGEDTDFNQKYIQACFGEQDFVILYAKQPRYFYFPGNADAVTNNIQASSAQTLPAPQVGYLAPFLQECDRVFSALKPADLTEQAYFLCHHYLRCFAFGIWSAAQLGEALPTGFFKRPEIRRLLALAKQHKLFSPYYLPFRFGLRRFCARLYAWDETRHINYWRAYEIMYRLFFKGWQKYT